MHRRNVHNKIKTPGYFIKRLKDSGFIVLKMFNDYNDLDPRRWTVLVDPQDSSVFITCFENKECLDEFTFELNDGNRKFPRNFLIQTKSMEVIVNYLISKGVNNINTDSKYINNGKEKTTV